VLQKQFFYSNPFADASRIVFFRYFLPGSLLKEFFGNKKGLSPARANQLILLVRLAGFEPAIYGLRIQNLRRVSCLAHQRQSRSRWNFSVSLQPNGERHLLQQFSIWKGPVLNFQSIVFFLAERSRKMQRAWNTLEKSKRVTAWFAVTPWIYW